MTWDVSEVLYGEAQWVDLHMPYSRLCTEDQTGQPLLYAEVLKRQFHDRRHCMLLQSIAAKTEGSPCQPRRKLQRIVPRGLLLRASATVACANLWDSPEGTG